jgi:hypothetical protein
MNGAVRDETLLRVTVPIMFVQVMSCTSTIVFFNGVSLVANLPIMFMLLIKNSKHSNCIILICFPAL